MKLCKDVVPIVDAGEIVNVNSEEEFRDKMFSWIEKQVLDGYPIWRLFKLNNWLKK